MSNHGMSGKRAYNKKKKILLKQGGKCAKCKCIIGIVSDLIAYGFTIYSPSRMLCFTPDYKQWVKVATFEHVTPVSKGGSNANDNLVLLCSSCNSKGGLLVQKSLKAQLASMRNIPGKLDGMK